MKTPHSVIAFVAAIVAGQALVAAPEAEKVVITEDFEHGADRWAPTAPAQWKIAGDHGGHVYDLFNKAQTFKTPHRSPFNFALLKDQSFSEITLTAKVKTTVKSYGHRDVVVVFGHRDPAHFYYVHFGEKADPHSCQVFIVNAADRTKISTKESTGIPWKDDTWHSLKVVWKASDGTIKVYFDDMDNTVMEAKDTTFAAGAVGIGSFDDTARFDDVRIEGVAAKK